IPHRHRPSMMNFVQNAKNNLKHYIDTHGRDITFMQDANTLIKFVVEEPERNKEFLHVIGKRDCYACLNSLPATSVCETCKMGLIHNHMVHGWGVNGEEVTVYYFKCDNCGDISTREENGR
ncbi:MAG TPA: hypothetical protein VFY68_00890, partial [Nitrososphaeraceae archaeon]|nr:hypothetical protein [Nitrososphaeraceae archaeon]